MVKDMAKVAVQIVTYNSEIEIEECLKAVYQQSYPISEIVVIDNCSHDGTASIIKRFGEIVFVQNQENNGFAGGHNQALKLHNSDFVLVLNPDVKLHKDYVLEIIRQMERDEWNGSATGKLYRDRKSRKLDSTGISMRKNRRAFDRGAGEEDCGQFDDKRELFGVSGAAAMYRRTMIDDISIDGHFFDEVFFAYKEDVDVSWRAQIFGWNSVFVPESFAEHARGWGEKRKREDISIRIRRHSYINRYYYLLKNDNFFCALLQFPIIFLYDLAMFLYAIWKEPSLLKAWGAFFQEYPGMLRKRRIIQNNRRKKQREIDSFFRGFW